MSEANRELAAALSDDASVMLIVAFNCAESGLVKSSDEIADFLGWDRRRARIAAQELVARNLVKALTVSKDPAS